MSTRLKRFLSMAMAIFMVISMMPANVVNAEGPADDDGNGDPVHEHSYEKAVTVPTCTAAGFTTYSCSCGDSYTADEVAAIDHTYGENDKCACGKLNPAHEHSYTSVVTAPTCTAAGFTTNTCVCGDVTTTDEVAAIGHTYGEDDKCACGELNPAHAHSYTSVVTAPTCTAAGFTTNTCVCGDVTTTDEVAAIDHTYGENDKCTCGKLNPAHEHSYTSVVTAPTCTAAGFTTNTCVCGDVTTTDEVAAIGHTYGEDDKCACGELNPAHAHSYEEGKCLCGAEDPDYVKPCVEGCWKEEGHEGECEIICTKDERCVLEDGHDGLCEAFGGMMLQEPQATVTELNPIVLTAAEHDYMVWPSGDDTVDRPLQIVMNFKTNDTLADAQASVYGKYKCDFYLSVSGLANGSLTADDCYLAGNYGTYGWIVIPTDGLLIENNVSYPIVSNYDANLTYENICDYVRDFTAAIFIAPALLDANPNMQVKLELRMTNPNDGNDILVIGEPAVYDVADLRAGTPKEPVIEIPSTGASFTGNTTEEVEQEITYAVQNNSAVNDFTPSNVPDGAKLEIVFTEAVVENDVPTRLVFDVTPMNGEGNKVTPDSAITFRLPVPSAWDGHAKVTHDENPMGIYEIKGSGDSKYVQISSKDFSEFAVEEDDSVVMIGNQGYESLDAALDDAKAAGVTEVEINILGDTTLNFGKADQFKKVTLTGTNRQQTVTIEHANNAEPSVDLTYNNLTVSRLKGDWLGQIYYSRGLQIFNDCKLIGMFIVTKNDATFTGCTFYNDDTFGDGKYNLWLYNCNDGVVANISGCTFDVYERAIKMYGDGYSNSVMTLNISGTTFTSRTQDKTVVDMAYANTTGKGIMQLNITGSTATGFADSTNPGVDIAQTWFNVKKESGNGNTGSVVTVDGKVVYSDCVAKIGNRPYVKFQDAINAVKNDEVIALIKECNEDVTFTQTADKSFVLDGNHQTYTGSINITARAGQDATSTLVIKNFNFKTTDAARNFIFSSETNYYPNNVTISGCTFEGSGPQSNVVPVKVKTADDLVIENCTANNVHSLLQNDRGGRNYTIRNCTVTNAGRGINLNSVQGALVENVKIEAADNKYGIRIDAEYENTLTIRDCDITAFIPVCVRKVSKNYNVVFEGTNTLTEKNTDGAKIAIGVEEYEENGKLPTTPITNRVVVTVNDPALNAILEKDYKTLVYGTKNHSGNKYFTVMPEGTLSAGTVKETNETAGSGSHINFGISGIVAHDSIEIKLYKGTTLLSTTKLVKKEYLSHNTLSAKIEIADESSSWETEWVTVPNAEQIPDRAELHIDGIMVSETNMIHMYSADDPSLKRNWTDIDGVAIIEVVNGAETSWHNTLADALDAAKDGATVHLHESTKVIDATGEVTEGKTVTITGKAKFRWGKAWLFVGRGNKSGDGKLIFKDAEITGVNAGDGSIGLNISGKEKGEPNKNNGSVEIINSNVDLVYVNSRGNLTVDNSTVTMVGGVFEGRGASETPDGKDATATVTIKNGSVFTITKTAGNKIGGEGLGVLNLENSTFVAKSNFAVTENKGVFNVSGESTVNIKTLSGNRINVADGATLTDSKIGGSITMLGDLTIDGGLELAGGLWASAGGKLSGDALKAHYAMFQKGEYVIDAELDLDYGYLSFDGTFDINSTIKTAGTSGEVLYIRGTVELNEGALLDCEKGIFLDNAASTLNVNAGAAIEASGITITQETAQLNVKGGNVTVTDTINNSGSFTLDTESVLTVKNLLGGVTIDTAALTRTEPVPVIYVSGNYDESKITVKGNATKKITDGDPDVVSVYFTAFVDKDGDQVIDAGEGYGTLEAAVAAAASGQTVYVLADTALTEQVKVNNDITITALAPVTVTATGIHDGNNNQIDAIVVGNGGKLTLGKNITIESDGAALWANGGDIIIDGAAVHSTGVKYTLAAVYAGSSLTVKSGSLVATANSVVSAQGAGAVVNMEGGSIETTCPEPNYVAVFAFNGAKINVTGGTVKAATSAGVVACANGEVTISAGTVFGVKAHENDKAKATITGGEIYGKVSTGNGATVFITGGWFDENPVANGATLADGMEWTETNKYIHHASLIAFIDENDNGIIDEGETGFTSIADAVAAENETVKLLNNVNGPVNIEKSVTIDLNGYKIDTAAASAGTDAVVVKGGNAAITDSTVNGSVGLVSVENGASLKLSNVAVAGVSAEGKVTVEAGAKITGDIQAQAGSEVIISSGVVGGGIGSVEGAKVEITGGTFGEDVSEYCAPGYVCVANEDGTYRVEMNVVRQIDVTKVADNKIKAGDIVYVDGEPYTVSSVNNKLIVEISSTLAKKSAMLLTSYEYKAPGTAGDYPTAMYVWIVKGDKNIDGDDVYDTFTVERMTNLDNFFKYEGTSIRVGTAKNGIRFFTSVDGDNVEKMKVGTFFANGDPLFGTKITSAGTEFWKTPNKKARSEVFGGSVGRTFRVFQKKAGDYWFTGVLTGLDTKPETIIDDIYSRPYATLTMRDGTVLTLYGGVLNRSIYYVATQNKDTFKEGSDNDKFIEKLITEGNKAIQEG